MDGCEETVMAVESAPVSPISKDRVPANSVPYKVKDGDSWEVIGNQFGKSAKELILFNFQTTN